MQETIHWFAQGLGARIDALEVAFRSLRTEEDPDSTVARNLARSLTGPAAVHGYESIRQAAQAVESAPAGALTESVLTLIGVLRGEAAKTKQAVSTLLIVGGDADFNARLSQDMSSPNRNIVCVDTAAEARTALKEQEVAFIVLNLFLPDLDGRAFLLQLRENTLTTSIPILILAEKLTDAVREEAQVLDADVLIETPPDTTEVRDRINARLRRAHESTKSARRDPLSGPAEPGRFP